MKMIYNGTPVSSMKVTHLDVSTNDATVVPSDLQAGITCYARGQKVTGTGKSFSFASYGGMSTNTPFPIPTDINVVEIASLDCPIQMNIELTQMHTLDFTSEITVGSAIVDGVAYDIKVSANNNMLNISCDRNIRLEVFYGKDEYV